MESNGRYYARRAVQEASAAARAVSPEARDWHRQLAEKFRQRAYEQAEAQPVL